jgi:hypothetical protein
MAAFGTNPAVHEADFQTPILSGCFTQKRSFRLLETRKYDRQLTAKSRRLNAPDAGKIPGVLGMQYVSPGRKSLFLRRAAVEAAKCR